MPSFLSLSIVSDVCWLAEYDTSLTVKVPAVWEHDMGEKWGSYDREKERTVQEGFEQRKSGGAVKSLLEAANEQKKGRGGL